MLVILRRPEAAAGVSSWSLFDVGVVKLMLDHAYVETTLQYEPGDEEAKRRVSSPLHAPIA